MDSNHKLVSFSGGRKFLHRLDGLIAKLVSLSGELRKNELLSKHTTIKVGGPARLFFVPESRSSLIQAVDYSRKYDIPYFILGSGSNLLFSDRGFSGLVISTTRINGLTLKGEYVFADCGVHLATLIAKTNAIKVTSLDFLSGIPGTLGGALAMNAGISECSIQEVVEDIEVLSIEGDVVHVGKDDCGFSYRTSRILNERIPVLGARLCLDGRQFNGPEILARRSATQPLGFASAGCAFKNPSGHSSAGELIEKAGLKGFQVGMVKVSDIHANFLINLGGASAAEISKIIDIVRQKVYKSFHILLELEIEVVDG
jgi:UDP-N-acetylmuramate dehydrogenase